jgi:hypothetical protein
LSLSGLVSRMVAEVAPASCSLAMAALICGN